MAHGSYQVLPPLAPEEFAALKADIAAHGILVPIEVDEHGAVLDGHHRLRAARELGLRDYRTVVRVGLTKDEKRMHARRVNLIRRHLSPEQKRLIIEEQLSETPSWSDRRIAGILGVSNSTVSVVRHAMEAVGKVCESNTSVGADGKLYPRLTTRNVTSSIREEEYAAPMVHFSSACAEWYTPNHILTRVVETLGAIDLDPCSNSQTNPYVPAAKHYTRTENGLAQPWAGRVFMNPPYGREIVQWVEKLKAAWDAQQITAALALLPARTDTSWFRVFRDFPICFLDGRLKFSGHENAAPFPSAVFYLGQDLPRFVRSFAAVGDVYRRLALEED